ncbi:MAG: UDP-2,4-diacetamido-2,4,6-trideoxy-beta-L-altropyranose hydrolase [Dissulfuribacterales bacterium]
MVFAKEKIIGKLFIRADSTPRIGTGHIMRCIALAQAWQDRGGKVIFISHCESDALQGRIKDEGFRLIDIEVPHPDRGDLKKTLFFIEFELRQSTQDSTGNALQPWVVLDGYHFDPDYQKAIKEAGYHLLVIDDQVHHSRYYADILLNQNIHAPGLQYTCDKDTVQLLGCDYALLRREFLQYKNRKRKIPQKATKILVTMGGADPDNVMLKVVQAINKINDPGLEVKIVAGPANPNIESLSAELSGVNYHYELLSNVTDMPGLMAWADIAVSAGGSTCWEIGFFGVPFLVVILAENQKDIAKGLADKGVAKCLGWYNEITSDQIAFELESIIEDVEQLKKMSDIGLQLIDGLGKGRVIDPFYEKKTP